MGKNMLSRALDLPLIHMNWFVSGSSNAPDRMHIRATEGTSLDRIVDVPGSSSKDGEWRTEGVRPLQEVAGSVAASTICLDD